jgi:hypothetical protein
MPRLARLRRDRPAGFGGRRGLASRPVPDQESGDAILRGAHGQAPAGGKIVNPIVFRQDPNHGGEGGIGETFFQSPEHALGLGGAQLDQAVGVEAGGRQADRVDPAVAKRLIRRQNPEHETGTAPENTGQETETEADGRGEIAGASGQ